MIHKMTFRLTFIATFLGSVILSTVYLPNILMHGVETKLRGLVGANTLFHRNTLASYENRGVVRPNNDTLYTAAWLDLEDAPLVLTIPDMGDRYFSFQFLTGDTFVSDVIGTRETGQQRQTVLITGPDWEPCQHSYDTVVAVPENDIWMLGRTFVANNTDLATAAELIERYSLSPAPGCVVR